MLGLKGSEISKQLIILLDTDIETMDALLADSKLVHSGGTV